MERPWVWSSVGDQGFHTQEADTLHLPQGGPNPSFSSIIYTPTTTTHTLSIMILGVYCSARLVPSYSGQFHLEVILLIQTPCTVAEGILQV